MRNWVFLLFFLVLDLIHQTSAQTKPKSSYDFDLKINHLVREQFYSLSAVYEFYKNIFIEAEYGYIYYHRVGVYMGYRYNLNNFTPFMSIGGFYQRENFTRNTYYDEYCLKLGGGLEMELLNRFYFNFETAALNYLSINYSMRKIKYRESYDFGESFDYMVSVGIGYRFCF